MFALSSQFFFTVMKILTLNINVKFQAYPFIGKVNLDINTQTKIFKIPICESETITTICESETITTLLDIRVGNKSNHLENSSKLGSKIKSLN